VVATTDSLVEGVHFRLDLCSARDVGFKAASTNLSDLAAMGSRPLTLLANLCLPGGREESLAIGITTGIRDACRRFGVGVSGGNLSASPGPVMVAVTALGEGLGDRFLTRSGARPGDDIWISGPVGDAALGLKLLSDHPGLARRFASLATAYRRPVARVELGLRLRETPGVTAAIDVSDGLVADLCHVLEASGVGAVLDLDAVPISCVARRFASVVGADLRATALCGGEDYHLLVCARPDVRAGVEFLGLERIGRVTARKGLKIPGIRGGLPRGYRHFT
jgi:thiamine-monophosphate kinase